MRTCYISNIILGTSDQLIRVQMKCTTCVEPYVPFAGGQKEANTVTTYILSVLYMRSNLEENRAWKWDNECGSWQGCGG